KSRDDAIHQTYNYIFDRYCKIRKQLSENEGIGDKKLYPLPTLQSTPGGGKSFFLDELASLKSKDLDRYLKIKLSELEKKQGSGEQQHYAKDIVYILRNSVRICITYNGSLPYSYDIDEDLRRGLVMRILWSYFFNRNKLD
ncbi:15126_t:CDS:1, partial [Cetraspora pellucida]